MVEIMAPAGSFESLQAALKAKADSVFFGVGDLNMRSHSADNFKIRDLQKIVKICREKKTKTYLTLNTILYDKDLNDMKKIIDSAKKSGVNAIIACDIAAIKYANSINMEVHSSTQLNISNIEAVRFYSKYCDVVVLARELNLKQIKEICRTIKKEKIKGPSGNLVKIEIFCHGALCVSISGKCYMSLAKHNCSANRGECYQPCRKKYRVIDEEDGTELVLDNEYIMSPKDLCTITFLGKIIKSGIDILKIEGRARAPEYVYTVTKVYKEASENFSKDKTDKWVKELSTVFNRGFWHGGYYLGKELGEWAGSKGSQATQKKFLIGKVVHYFEKPKVAHIDIEKNIKNGSKLLITGPTTGIVKISVEEVYSEGNPKKEGSGKDISIKIKEKVRKNDKVWLIKENN
jgi:U32 family peptidase